MMTHTTYDKWIGLFVVTAAVVALLLPPNADVFSAGTVGGPGCNWKLDGGQLCQGVDLTICTEGASKCLGVTMDTGSLSECEDNAGNVVDCASFPGCGPPHGGNPRHASHNATGCLQQK